MKKKSLDVFDFSEEDELAESASGKLLEKFANPSPSISPVLQRQRIQSLCQDKPDQKEEVEEGASCAEAATAVVDGHCEDAPALVTEAEDSTRDHLIESDVDHVNHGLAFGLSNDDHAKEAGVDDDNHGLMFGLNTEEHIKETEDHGLGSFSCQPSAESFYPEASSYSQPQLNSPLSDSSSSSEEEQTDMMSAIDESLSDRSALSDDSDSEGDEDWMAERCLDDIEKIDRSTTVIMIPEYVVLKDMPSAASLVIFSCNGIKLKSYHENNEDGQHSYEFGVEDIISIQYNWYQNVGLIILRIRVLLKDEKCHEGMQQTTDIEELKFAVKEHNWPEKQRQINSLHVKYPAVWSADLGDDVEVSGENLHQQQKRYFPRFDEPFEEVIYPKGDPDAVSICKRDVELLQPETFVNDTIIDFYINYLKNQIQAEERQRFHFFNSFFFRKLADLDKDPSSIADGKAAFLRVRKWTRKVDMFGKDYIFVPVNFNLHWSLIIICHPGEVANCTDLDFEDSTKVPCILHMDSIKGSHAGLKNLVQSYLCEEWKERHKDTSDDISSRFMNLRFVSLELPQQENSYDCGLFLLHYLELFLAEAPQNFSPFKIYNASNFLYLNWFPPAEASLKRTLIEKLIFELLENRSREVYNEQNQSCESPVSLNNNTGIEVLSGRAGIDCNGSMTQTQDDQGIEMTLLERSSMSNMQAVNDSGMVLRDLFDSGANNTGSLLGQLQQTLEEPSSFYHLGNNSSATEQVDMETGEQFMCLNSREGNFQSITGTAPPRESSWNLSMMPVQKESEADSLSETSKSSSSDSGDICIIEDMPPFNFYEEEAGESPPREAVSSFYATLGASTDHNTENEELTSTHDELVVVSSQDDREEAKQLENEDLGIGDKTSDDLGIELKTNEDLETGEKSSDALGIGDKRSDDFGTEDKPSDDLGIVDKSSDSLGIGDKTIEDLGNEDKLSEELGVEEKTCEDLGTEDKTTEDLGTEEKTKDLGDDFDQKEREPMEEEDEKRAAKRPRLSSTDEAEEMEE
ncbi:putative ubiquitin-like-specific protease 2B [Raphanus sativus]|uniref:Probable ubiquitin-like-specific protease 2B isoform X3 n=1 Tax=Raphanus sativus TaxID=3726 RepID=A0A9W3D902_RAPSA|nr:probable ubiquitin-like-specific protease 2B isoform X3 [Raphanus sativus]KAJ4914961.1 putative ubiquitin-like-specific protease 2B [Raphanus sativus]